MVAGVGVPNVPGALCSALQPSLPGVAGEATHPACTASGSLGTPCSVTAAARGRRNRKEVKVKAETHRQADADSTKAERKRKRKTGMGRERGTEEQKR